MEQVNSVEENSGEEVVINSTNSTNTTNSTNLSTPSNVNSPIEQKPVDPQLLEAIQEVYKNIDLAQNVKGVFTMDECVIIYKAKGTLLKFFEPDNKSFTSKEIDEAYLIYLNACNKQQPTGVFSIEGSFKLYNWLKLIEKEVENRKSPSEKIKALQQKKNGQQGVNTQKGGGRGARKKNV